MPFIYDAVKAYATLGEVCDAMRECSASTKKSQSPNNAKTHSRDFLLERASPQSRWCVRGCANRCARPEAKDKAPSTKSGFITTSDGVKIHYLEAGRAATSPSAQIGNPMPKDAVIKKGEIGLSAAHQFPSILFVPGWTMPAWIWQNQIDYFAHDYRVVAMDPRSQGRVVANERRLLSRGARKRHQGRGGSVASCACGDRGVVHGSCGDDGVRGSVRHERISRE